MGIRFHCPNGHKLNVKSFLAGKKGVCPDCGVKLRIPDRSEPGLDSGIDEGNQTAKLPQHVPATVTPATVTPAAATAPVMSSPAIATPAYVTQPAVVPHTAIRPAVVPQPVPAAGYVPAAVPQPAPMALQPPSYHPPAAGGATARVPMPPPPPGGVAADPIAENPLATWFVRPPSGGQFGPARGEVMRKWLTEGRVTADSLVWREGWADWLSATEVFPSLGKPAVALFGTAPATTKSAAAISGRKSSSGLGVALLVFLAVVCLVLVGVLAVVLSGTFSST